MAVEIVQENTVVKLMVHHFWVVIFNVPMTRLVRLHMKWNFSSFLQTKREIQNEHNESVVW